MKTTKKLSVQGTLFLTTLAIAPFGMTAGAQVQVCDDTILPIPAGCERVNGDVAVALPTGQNTERAKRPASGSFEDTGFAISIEGKPVAGAIPATVPQRPADRALERGDVDVRFDGLDQRRSLNVATSDLRSGFRAGEQVTFRASSNYPAYISRAEILVRDGSRRGTPVLARLPVAPNGTAAWVMPEDGSDQMEYVLRVYDSANRYDETIPVTLNRVAKNFTTDEKSGPVYAAGEGEDRTAIQRIPVDGGTITASGTGATPGGTVTVMGEEVPVDGQGRFAGTRILPAGDRVVSVNVDGTEYVRDVNIPSSDKFYTAIIDVTAGQRRDGGLGTKEGYVDGRVAFYYKSRYSNGWRATSSLDTQEGPIEDILRRIDDKDPRSVLDRLRADGRDLYPTYGDDSTYYDDTPTQGNVYIRAENDTTRLTWGNYTAGINRGGLVSNTRELYGAEARYASRAVTDKGESRFAFQAYAASPDTAPQRDILRGTGGSVYFLTRQDITNGTLNVTVRLVDPDTGRVVSNRTLQPGADYVVDHIAGVLLLNDPLGSTATDDALISDGIGRYDVNLIAQYEYRPAGGASDITAYGGRAEAWITDRLRFGATLMRENGAGGLDQDLASLDLRYELGERSFAELEYANTDGPGISRSSSTDGGLTIIDSAAGVAEGSALRFDSAFHFDDLGWQREGHIGLYYERKEAGFSTLSEDITADQRVFGINGAAALNDQLRLKFELEDFLSDTGDEKRSIEASLEYDVNDIWTVEAGLRNVDQFKLGAPDSSGGRTDGAVKVTYSPNDDLSVYAFGQATLERSGTIAKNNRVGVGFDAQITEKLRFSGEASDGSRGEAGALRLTYAAGPEREVYMGYTLDPAVRDFTDTDAAENGTLVFGTKYRINDQVSMHLENKTDLPGATSRSTSQAYGVNYTPTDLWSLSGAFETGEVRDNTGNLERVALSVGAAYDRDGDVTGRIRLEYRTDDGPGIARDRKTYGLSFGYGNSINENWRMLVDADALISDSDERAFLDGEYVRFSLGAAYRPIENEKVNALFRYTYYQDLPGVNQTDANGDDEGDKQRSHVLSANMLYDLNPKLTLGAKLGYRRGETAPRGTELFVDNTATLGVVRLDYHVVSKWDMLAEGRVLRTKQTGTTESGALLGLYRHVGSNAKIGLGYEWGQVSDDLTDVNYDGGGAFVNIIAKF
jgi:hypothetical protein